MFNNFKALVWVGLLACLLACSLLACSKSALPETEDTETNGEFDSNDSETSSATDVFDSETEDTETEDAGTNTYLSLAVGFEFVCGITTENNIFCWGENEDIVSNAPSGAFGNLSAGKNHVCAISENGNVECWGDNTDGQCDVPEGNFFEVRAGGKHSCGMTITDGSTLCWGDNSYGQATPPNHTYTEIQAHEDCTCGLLSDNSLECWGNSSYGHCENQDGPVHSFNFGNYREEGNDNPDDEHRYLCYLSEEEIFCPSYNLSSISTPSGNVSQIIGGDVTAYWLLENGILEAGAGSSWLQDDYVLQQQNEDGGFLSASSAYGQTCGLSPEQKPVCWSDSFYLMGGPIE